MRPPSRKEPHVRGGPPTGGPLTRALEGGFIELEAPHVLSDVYGKGPQLLYLLIYMGRPTTFVCIDIYGQGPHTYRGRLPPFCM
jgi:hypothetical protein